MTDCIRLRAVIETDLPELFAHQNDPQANQMAQFPARGLSDFLAHWQRLLADDHVLKRAVVCHDKLAGYLLCFRRDERHLIGYWIGRRFWGRGVATAAVLTFVDTLSIRPLYAHVAKANVPSQRVLEKCGFSRTAEPQPCPAKRDDVEEYIYVLSGTR